MVRYLAVTAVAFAGVLSAGTFTLEQVLSAPFPSELTAAPGGGAVAWLLNERGARNVWYAAAPDFKGVRLTAWTEDDGQDVGQLHFTADGKSLIFVRGGDLEFLGRPDPNPMGDPAGVEQDIWIVSPGETPRKIAQGHSPAVSPQGRSRWRSCARARSGPRRSTAGAARAVGAFAIGRDSGRAALVAGRREARLRQRSRQSQLHRRLRFRRQGPHLHGPERGSRQQSGVVARRQADRVYSSAADAAKRDAVRRAVERAVVDPRGHGGRRHGSPDLARRAGPGSVFHAMVAENQLFWGAGDRIVFPWEKDGWLHLYSVAAEGGAGHAADARRVRSRARIVHRGSARRRSSLRTRTTSTAGTSGAWRWLADRHAPSPAAKAWNGRPVAAAGGVAYLHADASVRRARPFRLGSGGTRSGAGFDSRRFSGGFPGHAAAGDLLRRPTACRFTASCSCRPTAKPGEKQPALVFMHGGSRRQMLLGWHYMDYYNNAYGMNQYLASQGYIVLSINYRSGIGYGLNFREATQLRRDGRERVQRCGRRGAVSARAARMWTRRISGCGAAATAAT